MDFIKSINFQGEVRYFAAEYDAAGNLVRETYATKEELTNSIRDLSDNISTGNANAVVSISEVPSPTYAKVYSLMQGAKEIGAIKIPKDSVVNSGSVKTVTVTDTPYAGARIGDKYIDLIIINSTSEHVYIPVQSLVDVYSAGNGLSLQDNTFSIKLVEGSDSYLKVTQEGIKLEGVESAINNKVDIEQGKALVPREEISKLAKLNLPDSELKETENTVQNKVVKAAIDQINSKLAWATLD